MQRIQRCLDYLYQMDQRKSLLCHNVNMNSSFALQLVRNSDTWYMVMLRRTSDGCLVRAITLSNACDTRNVATELLEALEKHGDCPACVICKQVAVDSGYCELCSLMQSDNSETCSICLEEERHTAVWVKTDCGHCYHYECLSKVQDRCPMCRAALSDKMKII